MATLKEVMRYALELDTKGFSKGLDQAERDAKDTFGDIEDSAESTGGRFQGLGGKMGKALVAGFGAVGVGALLMEGINSAMDARDGVRRLQGQFALTADEARRYGDLAGDLYAEGWGSGLEEVQQVVGTAAARLGTTTEDELSRISEAVLAVSKTWGHDFDAIIRSTSQLVQNDLAPNAEAALDLIVSAFQAGGDEAGDLLDTIDEYSQHWKNIGLDGEQAIGQLIAGLQAGQRDTDKVADAMKEMFIRVTDESESTREAMEALGLDADEMRQAFLRGGDDGVAAMQLIFDKLQENIDAGGGTVEAVALIGTQFEDLGKDAIPILQSITGEFEAAEGAAQGLTETVEANDWETFKRRSESALREGVELGARGANAALEDLAWGLQDVVGNDELQNWIRHGQTAFGEVEQVVKDFDRTLLDNAASWEEARAIAAEHTSGLLESEDTFGKVMTAADEAAMTLANEWVKAQRAAVLEVDDHTKAQELVADAIADAMGVTEDATGATEDATDAAEDNTEALRKQREETERLRLAKIDLIGGDIAVREAQRRARDATADYDKAMSDASLTADELAAAQDDAADALLNAAGVAVDYAADQAEANGAMLTGEDKARLMREQLEFMAGTLAPDSPLRSQIQGYIDDLAQIPREITTVVSVNASGNTIKKIQQGGQTIAIVDPTFTTPLLPGQVGLGATGAIVNRATAAIIGEAGPEAVVPLNRTPGNSPLPALMGGRTQGTTINLTVNAGLGTDGAHVGRQIIEVLKRFERMNGSLFT